MCNCISCAKKKVINFQIILNLLSQPEQSLLGHRLPKQHWQRILQLCFVSWRSIETSPLAGFRHCPQLCLDKKMTKEFLPGSSILAIAEGNYIPREMTLPGTKLSRKLHYLVLWKLSWRAGTWTARTIQNALWCQKYPHGMGGGTPDWGGTGTHYSSKRRHGRQMHMCRSMDKATNFPR